MRRFALIALAALVLPVGAASKAPPTGIELCGTNGCSTMDGQSAEQLFTLGRAPSVPSRPGPFFRLRWTWNTGQEETGGYWLPVENALRLGGWIAPDTAATATLTAAASGLEPFPVAPPTSVLVGRVAAADPASYARLLSEGSRVSTWVGALDWIRVRLASREPSPWTDASYDLRISKRSGFVWREGTVYRIPLVLARLARAGRSLAATASIVGSGARQPG